MPREATGLVAPQLIRQTLITLAHSVLALSFSGCYVASFFVPVSKTPADQARELDKKCRGFSDPGSLSLLVPDASIDTVEAKYAHVVDPPAEHLTGAQIHVRPWPGLSKESLTRTLECHEASVVLRKVPSIENDPYTLPEHWLDIDVDSEGDAFVVLLRTETFKDAQTVLARAKSYFATLRHPIMPPSALPAADLPAATPQPASTAAASPEPGLPVPASPARATPPSPLPAAVSPAPPAPSVPASPPASSTVSGARS